MRFSIRLCIYQSQFVTKPMQFGFVQKTTLFLLSITHDWNMIHFRLNNDGIVEIFPKGSFKNHVDKFLPFFDYLPTASGQTWSSNSLTTPLSTLTLRYWPPYLPNKNKCLSNFTPKIISVYNIMIIYTANILAHWKANKSQKSWKDSFWHYIKKMHR